MKKILKKYELNSDMEFFQMIVDHFLTGQFSTAYELFGEMPHKNRVEFLKSATVGGWKTGLGEHKLATLFDML